MSKEAYQQKLEARLAEEQANLDRAKAQLKGKAADARLEAEQHIGALEAKIAAAKGHIAKLADAGEEAWEDLKDDVEKAWDDVSATAKKFFSRITG
jgi:uncharacterized coiled-coil protein SlyX